MIARGRSPASTGKASAQVVAEALGLAVPHSALAPSGQPIWLDGAIRAVHGLQAQRTLGWSSANLTGAFSLSLLIGGVADVIIARWLGARGPRVLM